MDGAWTPGRVGLTLAERSQRTGAASTGAPEVSAPGVSAPGVSAPGQARHVWVTGPGLARRCAGLLAEWRRDSGDGQWRGRVVYAVDDGSGVVLVEAWVPAEHLHPAAR